MLAETAQTLVGDALTGSEVDVPAIERTVSDRSLDRLRVCDVTQKPKDTKNKDSSEDYLLEKKLGQGGMGDVFLARQRSLDRLLALKKIKPIEGKRRQQLMQTGRLDEVEEERKLQFLSEAIVTGDLDHPNIVPIHDVAVTAGGELFYSMKRVEGQPWSKTIKSLPQQENLSILLRVSDAIALAHTRGVVHRDIKPENIMLGDFGVVLVMDWGLALPSTSYQEKKPYSVLTTTGLGGTPAFMAPEMATGPIKNIGPAADIYLLGATLFMIVTGKPPHHASNVTECLKAVKMNKIRPVAFQHHGELLDVAMKAMASTPQNRYKSVPDFQQAIRDYINHSDSIKLSRLASIELAAAQENASYEQFSKASFQFEQALESWPQNRRAADGLAQTKIKHAELAYANGDFVAGIDLLDESETEHKSLLAKLNHGRNRQLSRESRLRLMRRIAAAMLLFILVGGTAAGIAIEMKRREAETARRDAVASAKAADKSAERARLSEEKALLAKTVAEQAAEKERLAKIQETRSKQEAIDAKTRADQSAEAANQAKVKEESQRKEAVKQREIAVANQKAAEDATAATKAALAKVQAERERANYETYVSKIGLAKAKIDRNEAQTARQILKELQAKSFYSGNWEWRWLWQQVNGSIATLDVDQPVAQISMHPNSSQGACLATDGSVSLFNVNGQQILDTGRSLTPDQSLDPVTSIQFLEDQNSIALGLASGKIALHDSQGQRIIGSHRDAVTDMDLVDGRYLVSGSRDRTTRAWDLDSRTELTSGKACWHLSPVRKLDAIRSADDLLVACSDHDTDSGRVTVWRIAIDNQQPTQQLGRFDGHDAPVTAIAIRSDDQLVATGDQAGNLLLWNLKEVQADNYLASIDNSLAKVARNQQLEPTQDQNRAISTQTHQPFLALIDPTTTPGQTPNGTLYKSAEASNNRGHADLIESLQFDTQGQYLLSGSDDYSIKQWDVSKGSLIQKMKGHGGWVTGVSHINGREDIVSASRDGTIRLWSPRRYRGDNFVARWNRTEPIVGQPNDRNTQPHRMQITSAKFSPSGDQLLTASFDHTARLLTIDPSTRSLGSEIELGNHTLAEGSDYFAMSMATDLYKRLLFLGSADSTVRVWNLATSVEIGEASGTGLNQSIAVSSDGTRLITGSSETNSKALIWTIDPSGNSAPQRLHRLGMHDQAVCCVAISPDGRTAFTGDGIGYAVVWDAVTGQPIGDPIETFRDYRINAAKFSNDSQSIWVGSDDGQVTEIDLSSRQPVRRLNHDGIVTDFAIDRLGSFVAVIDELQRTPGITSSLTLWNLADESKMLIDASENERDQTVVDGSRDQNAFDGVCFNPSANSLMVTKRSADGNSTILTWDQLDRLRSGAPPSQALQTPARIGSSEAIIALESSDCLTLNRNAAFRWDLQNLTLIKSYRSHAALTAGDFSPDGKFVATASRSLKLWDAESGKAIGKIESPHSGPIRTVAFHPVSNAQKGDEQKSYTFVTGADDGFARQWKFQPASMGDQISFQLVNQWKLTNPIKQDSDDYDQSKVRVVCFSDNGRTLLIAGSNGNAILAFPGTDKQTVKLPAADSADIACADFSDDGRYLSIGSSDNQAFVIPIGATGQAPTVVTLSGHADTITGIRMTGSKDTDYRIFTSSADDTVKIWDPMIRRKGDSWTVTATRGRELLSLDKHSADVTAVDLSEDGRLLVTAGKNGELILWPAAEAPEGLFDALPVQH